MSTISASAGLARRLLVSLLAAALSPAILSAQFSRGAVAGTVQDASGAVIPGATVSATNQTTGQVSSVSSQADGGYLIPDLQPGDYRLAAESDGFKRTEISGIRINAGTTVTQSFTLEVGVVTETVEVSGQTLMVETTSGRIGATVQVEQILELPMPNRDVFKLVNLVPGSFTVGDSDFTSIGGGRTQSQLAMVDGVNNTRGGLAVSNIEMSPPIDSMQEFKVEVNSTSAEFGRSNAGFINAVTKSGTNEFHGSFYEFLRNDALDAAGWNADGKPSLRRNNFGGTIGGPVVKNKTFFFYNYDGIRQRQGVLRTRNVGLPAWFQGDFSTATALIQGQVRVVPIHDPTTGTGTFTQPRSTTQFPNNVIPRDRFDPVARQVAPYMPGPNRAPNNPNNNAGNWQRNVVNSQDRDYHTARVDHEWSSKTRSFFRYILTAPDQTLTGYAPEFGVADPDGLAILNRRQNLALNLTHLFSPTFFVNATAGFNRVTINRKSGDCCETNYAQQFGLPEVSRVGGEAFPRFNIGGGLAPVSPLGAAGNANRLAAITNFDYIANFTKIAGSHTFKFGGNLMTFNANELSRPQPSGVWGFNGQFTAARNANGGTIANTGLPLGDFLLGRLNSIDARVAPGIGKRIRYFGGYFQDDWRVSSKLTLNFGIRYETETPAWEVADRMNGFDRQAPNPLAGTGDIPAGAIGVVTFPNRNGVGQYLWKWDKNNVAPRFGFAYRARGTDNTVIRGGFGVFYGNPYDREIIQQARAGFDNIFQARNPIPTVLSQGVPVGALDNIPESELLPTYGNRGTRFATSTIQFLDPDRVTQYSFNYNLNIQHQWKGVLFEIGYLANLGRKINFPNINLNHIPPDLLPRTDIPERFRRPWTIFTGNQPQIQILAPNWGLSNYHGFTFKSERRYANGLSWLIAYTHSQWIDNVIFTGGDNATFGDGDQIQNIYDIRNERSGSTNRIPHRLVVAPMFDLPFGKGRRFLDRGGVANAILGGWQVSTIGTMQSGAPFGVTVVNGARDILGDQADGKVLRADLVSSQLVSSRRGQPASGGVIGLEWLNPDAFATPAQFTHGNSSRTLPGVWGPGIINFEFMLAKNFQIKERFRTQFRWEMFNMWNTPQFQTPNSDWLGSNFGVVTGAGGRRIMQLALKLYW